MTVIHWPVDQQAAAVLGALFLTATMLSIGIYTGIQHLREQRALRRADK